MKIQEIQKEMMKEYEKRGKHPEIKVGDVVEVYTKIKEQDKERIQVFKGLVIAKNGSGTSKNITVRKISYGIGVEKIFPIFSPNISKIKVVSESRVRRSKLYFLRNRVGKSALKSGVAIPVEGKTTIFEEEEKEESKKGKEEKIDKAKEKNIEKTSESNKNDSSESAKIGTTKGEIKSANEKKAE